MGSWSYVQRRGSARRPSKSVSAMIYSNTPPQRCPRGFKSSEYIPELPLFQSALRFEVANWRGSDLTPCPANPRCPARERRTCLCRSVRGGSDELFAVPWEHNGPGGVGEPANRRICAWITVHRRGR